MKRVSSSRWTFKAWNHFCSKSVVFFWRKHCCQPTKRKKETFSKFVPNGKHIRLFEIDKRHQNLAIVEESWCELSLNCSNVARKVFASRSPNSQSCLQRSTIVAKMNFLRRLDFDRSVVLWVLLVSHNCRRITSQRRWPKVYPEVHSEVV